MKKCEIAVFSHSGVTSWGDTWEWVFDSGVELKASDGHTLLVTDLHTQLPDYNFEDDVFDRSFSMSKEQDFEWEQICWDCYLLESVIYSRAWMSFESSADQLIQDFKAKNPNAAYLSDDEFSGMLAACLDVIRKQWGWDSENLEWLFNYGGPLNSAVDEWLTDSFAKQ